MSAFQCCNTHINALVAAAFGEGIKKQWFAVYNDGKRYEMTERELGELLTEENAKSIAYRYPNEPKADVQFVPAQPYVFSLTPVEVLKACDCYEYQACEHPGWERSVAAACVQRIRKDYIKKLAGYDEAAWEITTGKFGQAA